MRSRSRPDRTDRARRRAARQQGTQMTFNPNTDADREAMLTGIGVGAIEDLFAPVGEAVRFPELRLPRPLTEMEAAARLAELAARNLAPTDRDVFLGAGSYRHY